MFEHSGIWQNHQNIQYCAWTAALFWQLPFFLVFARARWITWWFWAPNAKAAGLWTHQELNPQPAGNTCSLAPTAPPPEDVLRTHDDTKKRANFALNHFSLSLCGILFEFLKLEELEAVYFSWLHEEKVTWLKLNQCFCLSTSWQSCSILQLNRYLFQSKSCFNKHVTELALIYSIVRFGFCVPIRFLQKCLRI